VSFSCELVRLGGVFGRTPKLCQDDRVASTAVLSAVFVSVG